MRQAKTVLALALFVFALGAPSCSSVASYVPSMHAETTAQHAFAAYATYAVTAEYAAEIMADADTPREVKAGIWSAMRATKAPADTLLEALISYDRVRDAYIRGDTTEAAVSGALEALAASITAMRGPLTALIGQVTGYLEAHQ